LSLRFFTSGHPSPGLGGAACLLLVGMLQGCGAAHAVFGTHAPAAAPQDVPLPVRGTPVPPAVARALDVAPAGGRVDYPLAQGAQVSLVLGPLYQSAWAVPCRVGTVSGVGIAGGSPTAFAFCREGEQWHEMPPVVVSGY
jgi:hypothetical protein